MRIVKFAFDRRYGFYFFSLELSWGVKMETSLVIVEIVEIKPLLLCLIDDSFCLSKTITQKETFTYF